MKAWVALAGERVHALVLPLPAATATNTPLATRLLMTATGHHDNGKP